MEVTDLPASSPTLSGREYENGFYTDIEADQAPKGLNEEIIRFISAKKGEPEQEEVLMLPALH